MKMGKGFRYRCWQLRRWCRGWVFRLMIGWPIRISIGLGIFGFVVSMFCYVGWYAVDRYIEPFRWQVTDVAAETAAMLAGKTLSVDGVASVKSPPRFTVDWNNPCYTAALILSEQQRVPKNVVVNIIHTESRGKPEAVGQNTNATADHGCMQLNDKWFAQRFQSPADMYIAAKNVEVGIQVLKERYAETGDWDKAATMYHSRTASKRQRYKRSLVSSSKATGAPLDSSGLNNLLREVY